MDRFTQKKFVKYCLGDIGIRGHIDAVHACQPNSDLFTGEITQGIIEKIDCSGIIATKSRDDADLNRLPMANNQDAIDEYRDAIEKILTHLDIYKDGVLIKPYLHLAIHGMKDRNGLDFAIGSLKCGSCSDSVQKWFMDQLSDYKYDLNGLFPGDISKDSHRSKYGCNFNTIQIEISHAMRLNRQSILIDLLSSILINFNKAF